MLFNCACGGLAEIWLLGSITSFIAGIFGWNVYKNKTQENEEVEEVKVEKLHSATALFPELILYTPEDIFEQVDECLYTIQSKYVGECNNDLVRERIKYDVLTLLEMKSNQLLLPRKIKEMLGECTIVSYRDEVSINFRNMNSLFTNWLNKREVSEVIFKYKC